MTVTLIIAWTEYSICSSPTISLTFLDKMDPIAAILHPSFLSSKRTICAKNDSPIKLVK